MFTKAIQRARLTGMKPALLFCLALCGCASSQMLLVNNTGRDLTVTVGGSSSPVVVTNGQTYTVQPAAWCDKTPVTVVGSGGANSWVFYNSQGQVWQVNHLNPPR